MDKTLRVLGGGEDVSHGHPHSCSIAESVAQVSVQASGIASPASAGGLRSRGSEKPPPPASLQEDSSKSISTNSLSKLSAYLNLFGDFVHNMWAFALYNFYQRPVANAIYSAVQTALRKSPFLPCSCYLILFCLLVWPAPSTPLLS